MQNSKYITSWGVYKLPNGIYQLIFNTIEKWIQYHRYSATEYLFWIDGKEDVQEIPEFLPNVGGISYQIADSQNKDQITFYFIPFRKNWLKQGKIQQILHS